MIWFKRYDINSRFCALLLTTIGISGAIVGNEGATGTALCDARFHNQSQGASKQIEVAPVNTAGEIVELLSEENGSEIFDRQIRGRVTREAGWRVIVMSLPGDVPGSTGQRFEAVEDYSGVEVYFTTERDFGKEIRIGDAIWVWGRVWYGFEFMHNGFVCLDQARIAIREQPSWWAKNGHEFMKMVPTSIGEALKMVGLIYLLFILLRGSVRLIRKKQAANNYSTE